MADNRDGHVKNRRNDYEYQVLVRVAEILPARVRVRIVADRGFGDQKLYRVLTDELRFDFVIRFRGNITVTAAHGEARAAADWVGAGGRARVLRGATVTAAGYPVSAMVCLQAEDMKQPWCLAASTAEDSARALVNLYAKCWGIEGASAWGWARCSSAPQTGATVRVGSSAQLYITKIEYSGLASGSPSSGCYGLRLAFKIVEPAKPKTATKGVASDPARNNSRKARTPGPRR